MSITKIIMIIFCIIAITAILLFLTFPAAFSIWIISNWLDILFAVLLALIVGLLIKFFYKKYSKSRILQTTITPSSKPEQFQAKLVLKENQEIIIKEYERIFGREDFIGIILSDNLIFVGKKHFKISRREDGFYIEDLNTKNGTFLNGENITGKGGIKLKNEDKILVAKTLELRYVEK